MNGNSKFLISSMISTNKRYTRTSSWPPTHTHEGSGNNIICSLYKKKAFMADQHRHGMRKKQGSTPGLNRGPLAYKLRVNPKRESYH